MAGTGSVASEMCNKFSWDMYMKLAASNEQSNLMYSPLSIHTALSMTYHGARDDTRKQLAEALHVTLCDSDLHLAENYHALLKSLSANDPTFILHQANRLYIQKNYKVVEEFIKTLSDVYGAELGLVDFVGKAESARVEINQWVEEQTAEKIKGLLPPESIDSAVRAVIVNAIYFKGIWMKQFDPDETNTMPFFTNKEETVNVKMMSQKATFKVSEDSKLKVRALELPYCKNQMSLVIVLPDEMHGLATVEASLSSSRINALVANTRIVNNLKVMIPQFKLEHTFSLPETLKTLGVLDLFSLDKCNLSGVSDANDLVVSDVIHKAFIEVNEEGSEAAAATAVVMVKRCAMMPPKSQQFIANHPFLFFIRDNKSATILFMGRLLKPTPAHV